MNMFQKSKKDKKPLVKKLEEVDKLFNEICKDAAEVLTLPKKKKEEENGSVN